MDSSLLLLESGVGLLLSGVPLLLGRGDGGLGLDALEALLLEASLGGEDLALELLLEAREAGVNTHIGGGVVLHGGLGRGSGGSLGGGGGSGLLLSLLLELLSIAVEEEVDGDGPGLGHGDRATETENLAGEHPVHETDGVLATVVAGNGNIDEAEGRVGVAKGDDGDTDVAGLVDGLLVKAGVSDNEKTGLLEVLGDLVGEGTRGETGREGLAAGVVGELEDSALAVGAGSDGDNVGGVLNGHNDASSKLDLLDGLADVEDVDTIAVAAPDVGAHLVVAVGGADVDLGSEHALDVLLAGGKGSHGA